jgi:hypothetical protein
MFLSVFVVRAKTIPAAAILVPNGELTSAAVLLREQPGFYEKPRFSRRLVKRLVGRSRYAAGKKSKIVYNSYNCPISGT